MNLDVFTVCINYSDYFVHTISSNSKCFKNWYIITVPEDKETIELCKSNNLKYCFSDRVFNNGGFNKGMAINDAILQVNPQDWIAVLDADTFFVFSNFNELIKDFDYSKDDLIGLYGRYKINTLEELEEFKKRETVTSDDLDCVGLLPGFFQMWHSSMRPMYPESFNHAGGDDILLRDSYNMKNWKFLPTYAAHLGPIFTNHKGRKSEKFK